MNTEHDTPTTQTILDQFDGQPIADLGAADIQPGTVNHNGPAPVVRFKLPGHLTAGVAWRPRHGNYQIVLGNVCVETGRVLAPIQSDFAAAAADIPHVLRELIGKVVAKGYGQ